MIRHHSYFFGCDQSPLIWQRTKSHPDPPLSHSGPFQPSIGVLDPTFLYLISVFDLSHIHYVQLRLSPFLLDMTELFTDCYFPIHPSFLGEWGWFYLLKLCDKSIRQNVYDCFIPGWSWGAAHVPLWVVFTLVRSSSMLLPFFTFSRYAPQCLHWWVWFVRLRPCHLSAHAPDFLPTTCPCTLLSVYTSELLLSCQPLSPACACSPVFTLASFCFPACDFFHLLACTPKCLHSRAFTFPSATFFTQLLWVYLTYHSAHWSLFQQPSLRHDHPPACILHGDPWLVFSLPDYHPSKFFVVYCQKAHLVLAYFQWTTAITRDQVMEGP